ncbi:MAG: FAD-dependent oxidoreductase [Gammaproteobacteria bacterium]|nr:FAD-dependent oxidoreductase [Gammaproteobacteria bacterium]
MPASRRTLDRRTLLTAAASTTALAALPRPLRAGTRSRVLVLGAGLSGLHAALTLQEAGLDVRVIEGRDRVGGRVLSHRNVPGNPESGATSFAPGYARLISACAAYGVGLVDLTPIFPFFLQRDLYLGTERVPLSAWPTHPHNPFPEPLKKLPPWAFLGAVVGPKNPLATNDAWLDPAHAALDVSLHDWLKGLGWSDEMIHIAYDIGPGTGDSARNVSALMTLGSMKFQQVQMELARGKAMSYTAVGGNQAIPEAMAKALKNPVELGRKVVAIGADGQGVEVHCEGGQRYRADHVVCSIPTTVLRTIRIEPALPATQAKAVRELGVQTISLAHLATKRPFWEDDGGAASFTSDGALALVTAERKGSDPKQVTSLTAWLRGAHAARFDRMPEAEARAGIVREIERLRPAAKGQLEVLAWQSWKNDPFALGDWAVWEPGQVTAFAGVVGKAHGRLHFCGEHTAVSNRGMEGAMESGERAALEVLQSA